MNEVIVQVPGDQRIESRSEVELGKKSISMHVPEYVAKLLVSFAPSPLPQNVFVDVTHHACDVIRPPSSSLRSGQPRHVEHNPHDYAARYSCADVKLEQRRATHCAHD